MPWTLYRYILRELLKILLLTVTVLILVVSFAVAVKPLSDGLLGPASLVKFILYTAPTMLTFVLPFAGAFASTLVFIRMASDNEITACLASGMSYRSVLTPVFGLGLACTLSLFILSNFVLPGFNRAAALTVQKDLLSILVTRLNQGMPFDKFKGVVVYADSAVQESGDVLSPEVVATLPSRPERVVQLNGVAVGKVDRQNRIGIEATSERATVLLFRDEQTSRSWVSLLLNEVMYYDPIRGELAYTARTEPRTFVLPNPYRDNPRFLSMGELWQLDGDPTRFDAVREDMATLRRALMQARLRELVVAELSKSGGGTVALRGPVPGEEYVITSDVAVPKTGRIRLTPVGDEQIRVELRDGQRVARVFEAQGGTLRVMIDELDDEPVVAVELRGVRVRDPRSASRFTEHSVYRLPRLVWSQPLFDSPLTELGPKELLAMASERRFERSEDVEKASWSLSMRLFKLAKEIIATLHERAATAAAALLLILLGAILSIQMKHRMPLVVYAVSFVLAIITLILIGSGKNMASGQDVSFWTGLVVLWSGNVLLTVIIGLTYCRLARN